MRKFAPVLLSLMLFIPAYSQSQKRRGTPVKKPEGLTGKPGMSPCGVYYDSWDEFIEELEVKWRVVAASKKSLLYYSTSDVLCDTETKVLKVWIKEVPDKEASASYAYALDRYEVRCNSEQFRMTSTALYDKDGGVIDSASESSPSWKDAVPESIGQSIVQTVCRKPRRD